MCDKFEVKFLMKQVEYIHRCVFGYIYQWENDEIWFEDELGQKEFCLSSQKSTEVLIRGLGRGPPRVSINGTIRVIDHDQL